MKLDEKIAAMVESLGYGYDLGEDGLLELQKPTPMGVEWIVPIEFDGSIGGFADEVEAFFRAFDVDEETEMRIPFRGELSSAPTIREILEDQEWKESQLSILSLEAVALKDGR